MLKLILSCRANMTDSGISSRVAGETLGASAHLPTMATEEFLSCLSRQALERSAVAEGVNVEIRVKDTRAALVKRFGEATWHFPGARFRVTEEERANAAKRGGVWVGGGRTQAGDSGPDTDPEDGADVVAAG